MNSGDFNGVFTFKGDFEDLGVFFTDELFFRADFGVLAAAAAGVFDLGVLAGVALGVFTVLRAGVFFVLLAGDFAGEATTADKLVFVKRSANNAYKYFILELALFEAKN